MESYKIFILTTPLVLSGCAQNMDGFVYSPIVQTPRPTRLVLDEQQLSDYKTKSIHIPDNSADIKNYDDDVYHPGERIDLKKLKILPSVKPIIKKIKSNPNKYGIPDLLGKYSDGFMKEIDALNLQNKYVAELNYNNYILKSDRLVSVKYDADEEIATVSIRTDGAKYGNYFHIDNDPAIKNTYIGSNAFGYTAKINYSKSIGYGVSVTNFPSKYFEKAQGYAHAGTVFSSQGILFRLKMPPAVAKVFSRSPLGTLFYGKFTTPILDSTYSRFAPSINDHNESIYENTALSFTLNKFQVVNLKTGEVFVNLPVE